MTDIQRVLGKNIKEARKRLGFTQAVLAEKIGTSTSFVGELEICKKFVGAEVLQKIADVLGLKPYQLFLDGESEKKELDKPKLLAQLSKDLKKKIIVDLEETISEYSRE